MGMQVTKRTQELIKILINRVPPGHVNLVEIGTYLGENAIGMIKLLRSKKYTVTYTGFDLFENIAKKKELQNTNPGIYKQLVADPNKKLVKKISVASVRSRMEKNGVAAYATLIKGNTKNTLERHQRGVSAADFIYIDGGHDYASVSRDWKNVVRFGTPGTIVVFDDTHTVGVGRLMRELREEGRKVKRAYGNRGFLRL